MLAITAQVKSPGAFISSELLRNLFPVQIIQRQREQIAMNAVMQTSMISSKSTEHLAQYLFPKYTNATILECELKLLQKHA